MNNLLSKRFEELIEQQKVVHASKSIHQGMHGYSVDRDILLNWVVKAKSLLSRVCGIDSEHFKHFCEAEIGGMYRTNLDTFNSMKAVFLAAKEDHDGGYLVSIRGLVQADVFSSELEQASELLKSGYAVPAAVIAGAVLETAIRDLCTRNGIAHAKLDKMNADLTKEKVYNGIMQKRITHLAAVRNSAAHGNKEEFETYDVRAMIDEVERFLAGHLQ
jgi:hypothetical protein